MRIIYELEIRRHVAVTDILEAVEKAFEAYGRGASVLFPVARGTGSDPDHVIAVKSGLDGSTGLLGVKVAGYNPANKRHGRQAHSSTTLLIDDATSEVLAVVEAGYLNGMRTAAADAVAVRHLAREDARTLGIIGTGSQAVFEVEAIAAVRDLTIVNAATRSAAKDAAFAGKVLERTGLMVNFLSLRETVEAADILVTATPATAPLFAADWVRPGTHISAMGSDNVGKQELPIALFPSARFFVDDADQSVRLGEGQHIVSAGLATADDIATRTLGAVVCGLIEGRNSDDEITIFDSSGLSIQDIAAAKAAMDLITAALEREAADTFPQIRS